MADTLIPGLAPVRESELGDTIFEELGQLGIVDDETLITLNLGPQHPSTHGVFRLIMQLQGETVIGSIPVMGYLHRSTEKLGEARTYVQGTVLTDRMDYLSPITSNWAYALAIERLTGLIVPERAEFLRVITGELSRIQSHLVAVGTFGMDVGTYGTPLLYALREREMVLDLMALPTGVRMNPSYIRYGGVARDAPPEFFPQLEKFLRLFPSRIDEYERILSGNEVFKNRTIGVGMIPPEVAKAYSVTGPILRASGIDYDVRRAEPYSVYDRFDYDVPVRYNGDCFDRYMIRILEMRQSTRILQQALDLIPEGDIRAKLPKVLKPPKGEAYARVESPKGEIGFYLVSDGTANPYRYNVRPPSFVNLTCLSQIAVGHKLADAVVILGSFDIVMGEVRPVIAEYYAKHDFWLSLGLPIREWLISIGVPGWVVSVLYAGIGAVSILGLLTIFVILAIWAERRFIARLQDRWGPNRVGPFGLLQSVADAVKLLAKEIITPGQVDRLLHYLAPMLILGASLMSWAVIPWGPGLQVADLNVAVLYLLAFGAIPALGVTLAGWASMNKYSLFGGMRAVVQYVSYEVPGAIVLVVPVLMAASMSLQQIVFAQSGPVWNWFVFQPVFFALNVIPIPVPIVGTVAFVFFLIAGLAETNRTPFDHVEADSELTGGFTTEYSGMQFALFFLAEYGNSVVVGLLGATLFLGGYHTGLGDSFDNAIWPLLPGVLVSKAVVIFLIFVWVRGTLPRFRYDQLMQFAWKRMLPVSLALVALSALLASLTMILSPVLRFAPGVR